jgi:DNA mismatch repair protein MLH1
LYSIIPSDADATPQQSWTIQHMFFPAFRDFRPPKKFANDGTVIEIASLENLYKVFERC